MSNQKDANADIDLGAFMVSCDLMQYFDGVVVDGLVLQSCVSDGDRLDWRMVRVDQPEA